MPDPSPAPTATPIPTVTLPTPTVTSTGTQTQPASIIENYCGNNSSLACIAMFAQDTATMIDLVGAGTEVALIAIGCFAGGPSGCVAGVGVSWELWNVPIVGPISLNGAETTLSITSGVLTVIDDAQDNELGDATVTAVVTNIVGGISPDPIIDLFMDGYGTGYSHGVFNGILTIWNGGPLIP